jgi:hypothetical protein
MPIAELDVPRLIDAVEPGQRRPLLVGEGAGLDPERGGDRISRDLAQHDEHYDGDAEQGDHRAKQPAAEPAQVRHQQPPGIGGTTIIARSGLGVGE